MKCVYNNKNNGLAINVINNRLNISNAWKKNNPDYFWDSGYDSESRRIILPRRVILA